MSDESTLPVQQVGVSVDAQGVIHVKPDPVVVNTHNALIVFTLSTDGYVFPATDAIDVTTPNSDFPYSAWTIKPQQAALMDIGNNAGDYKYSVTVVNQATGVATTLDPIIHNGTPAS